MSTAARVPETWDFTGDDPKEALASTGRIRLLQSAFTRFRRADGTSHSRSLAFATSLVLVQGIVVLVGFAAAFGQSGITSTIVETIRSAVPGPASDVLAEAVRQANRVGNQDRFLLLTLGLIGLLITSTTAMGQMERGLNRIYGIEKDGPTGKKYGLAFVLTLTVGTGLAIAFLLLGFGRSIGKSWGHEARVAWEILRWPIGLALIAVCLAALLRHSANRRQPGRAWLAFGSGVAVVLVGPLDDRARHRVPTRLELRPDLRAAGGHRRTPALDLPLVVQHLLRGVGGGRAEAIRAGAGETRAARTEASAPHARASLQG